MTLMVSPATSRRVVKLKSTSSLSGKFGAGERVLLDRLHPGFAVQRRHHPAAAEGLDGDSGYSVMLHLMVPSYTVLLLA